MVVLDAQRRDSNDALAPSLTVEVLVLGSARLLGRYRTEGFAGLEGEIEGGLLAAYARNRLHLDANLITGSGFEGREGREGDAAFLARGGYDVCDFLRIGAEGRGRYKLARLAALPGNRAWDAFGGAQVLAFADSYFGAITAGPSTVGIVDRVGLGAIATFGGVVF